MITTPPYGETPKRGGTRWDLIEARASNSPGFATRPQPEPSCPATTEAITDRELSDHTEDRAAEISLKALATRPDHPARIESQLMQHRGVNVGERNGDLPPHET